MAEPISFPSTTKNLGLPLLFSGQAQKEFTINQSFAVLDILTRGSVQETRDEPPTEAQDGQCFLVSENAIGDWTGHSGQIAARVAGSWHFVDASEGMEIYDLAAGQKRIFKSEWQVPSTPAQAQGGNVVDAEARALLADLISSLRSAGIFADPE
ncbi:MAG: DUF2793 domain-containing protein [Pseudomonadota bacterium]